jgi:hypothetical protein
MWEHRGPEEATMQHGDHVKITGKDGGRGTTVLESLLNDRKGLGCDTNPVAFCLSKAKADAPKQ